MSEDPIICYCYGLKRDDIAARLAQPGMRLDDLISETKIATKCTACSTDLNAMIDEMHCSERLNSLRAVELKASTQGWKRKVDRIDSGFFICDGEIETALRFANHPPFSGDEGLCAPHNYTVTLFDNDGRVCVRHKGSVAVREECTIEFKRLRDCPERGWFLLHMRPQGPGRYGTLRPQVALKGNGWISCYHTQFHTDATRAGRRSGVPLWLVEGRTRAQISIVNGSPTATHFHATLETDAGVQRAEGTIAANGACMFDIDSSFPAVPKSGPVILRIDSEQPTRKNVLNRHPDGSLGVDHFPNMV